MKYIVYRNYFESYRIPQGEGYFVSYKNKLCDEWSPNWVFAKKYTSLGSAIDRLGIDIKGISTDEGLQKFLHQNADIKLLNRTNILNNLLDNETEIEYPDNFFLNGRIDKVSDTGEFLGSANKEVMDFINNTILKNKNVIISAKNKINSLYVNQKLSTEGDFWDWVK